MKFTEEQLNHWRDCLDFIEEQQLPRVLTDYCIDMAAAIDPLPGSQLMRYTYKYFDEVDLKSKGGES